MGTVTGCVVIPKSEIVSLKRKALPPDPVVEDGQILRKLAEAEKDHGKAAQAWLRVGEFYESHPGFYPHAKASFEKVLLFDGDNAAARGKLGYVKTEKGWQKAEVKKAEPAEAAQAKAQPAADELTIGLRRDADVVRKLLDEQAARIEALRDLDRRRTRVAERDDFGYYPNRGLYYWDPAGLYYYSPGSIVYVDNGGPFGYGSGGYGSGGYGSGGYGSGGYGYNNWYGSGVSVGFRGHFGSVHFRGTVNSGYSGRGTRF